MASFRIDQATQPAGIAGRARHDLVVSHVVTLTATDPVTDGTTYAWEILDKVNSATLFPGALLTATGISTTLSLGAEAPCAFFIQLTATEPNGTVTTTERVLSVVTPATRLRVPLFREKSVAANKLGAHVDDSSTDNALYTDLAGLGTPEQNWRGWAEWAYEIVQAIEAAGDGSAAGTFVYRPGGVRLGNVYTTWADLYAAASVAEGSVTVQIDDSLAVVTIPAGTYNFQDWILIGHNPGGVVATVTVMNLVTINGSFQASKLSIHPDVGSTAPAFMAGGNTFDFTDVTLSGSSLATGLFYENGGDFPATFNMRGSSSASLGALNTTAIMLNLYDLSIISADAIASGHGTYNSYIVRILSRAARWAYPTGWAAYLVVVETPDVLFHGPLDATQVGVTGLHLGSIYVEGMQRILALSAAMLGGGIATDTAILTLKKFTGGATVATWTRTALLGEAVLPADVVVVGDWYDLYLSASGAGETAIVKGLRLLAVIA